jgi:ribosomal protein S12 methylthiotransferase
LRIYSFYVLTLGCPKNTVDSEGITQLLSEAGYEATTDPRRAQVLIVNTCGFLQAAAEESLGALQDLARHKRKEQLLIAAGCLAQRAGAWLAEAVPAVDGLIGTRNWPDIVSFVRQLQSVGIFCQRDGGGKCRQPLLHLSENWHVPPQYVAVARRNEARASAYLKIGDGCSAPCAFCTIPSIKGPGRSRPRETILGEARQLVAQGVQEIILIAQDTTAYGRDLGERDGLPGLLEEIVKACPSLRWLRLMYAYPGHASRRLIDTMAAHPQICHYLDLPLQHGHPETLRRMARPHNVERVRRFIEDLRATMPDIVLRTTFIVGYPGETEIEFQALLDFMVEMAFDKVGVFAYSSESGTLAASLPDQVPVEVKQERAECALAAQQSISLDRNRAQVGRTLDVLIEGTGNGISVGRTYRDAPEIDGLILLEEELSVGIMIPVRITGATTYDLIGTRE